jgi:hypothetical protein
MFYSPIWPPNRLPPYYFDPNFRNALMNGYPFPYNVLNYPFFYDEGVHPGYGNGSLYNKQQVEPTKVDLEIEYEDIMENQLEPEQEKNDEAEESSKKKQTNINALISFDKLTAGTIQSSSGIFNGKNIQFGWSAHSKTNNGFGTVSGNSNTFHNNINVVFDNDQLDTPIDDRGIMWGPVPSP